VEASKCRLHQNVHLFSRKSWAHVEQAGRTPCRALLSACGAVRPDTSPWRSVAFLRGVIGSTHSV